MKVSEGQTAQTRSLLLVAMAVVYDPAAHGALTSLHESPPLIAEYVVPTWQAAHVRSAVAEPAESWPKPAGQVAHATHDMRPSLAAKVPKTHGAQVRSLLAVATAVVYDPAAHGGLTSLQAPPDTSAENVYPISHGAHSRSAVDEPAVTCPYPSWHAVQSVHFSPASAANVPDGHGAHARSLLNVAALKRNVPAGHRGLVTMHVAEFSISEYVPAKHAAHVRSAVGEPALETLVPGAQVVQATHVKLPADGAKCCVGHSSHIRSLVAVAAAAMNWPARQALRTLTHAAVPRLAENVNPTVHGAHLRSA